VLPHGERHDARPGPARADLAQQRDADLGLGEPGIDEHDIHRVSLEHMHRAHGIADGTAQGQAIRDPDEPGEALADTPIRVHDEHANGLGRASHHVAASARRHATRHRRMSRPGRDE
jgi:hypothetical protein